MRMSPASDMKVLQVVFELRFSACGAEQRQPLGVRKTKTLEKQARVLKVSNNRGNLINKMLNYVGNLCSTYHTLIHPDCFKRISGIAYYTFQQFQKLHRAELLDP